MNSPEVLIANYALPIPVMVFGSLEDHDNYRQEVRADSILLQHGRFRTIRQARQDPLDAIEHRVTTLKAPYRGEQSLGEIFNYLQNKELNPRQRIEKLKIGLKTWGAMKHKDSGIADLAEIAARLDGNVHVMFEPTHRSMIEARFLSQISWARRHRVLQLTDTSLEFLAPTIEKNATVNAVHRALVSNGLTGLSYHALSTPSTVSERTIQELSPLIVQFEYTGGVEDRADLVHTQPSPKDPLMQLKDLRERAVPIAQVIYAVPYNRLRPIEEVRRIIDNIRNI